VERAGRIVAAGLAGILFTVAAAAGASSANGEGYFVTIKTEQDGVYLEREIGTTTVGDAVGVHWKRVCSAPCNVAVPEDASYRLSGHGYRPSDPFSIRSTSTINAKLSTSAGFGAALGFGIGGAALVVTGLALLRVEDTVTTRYDTTTGQAISETEPSGARKLAPAFLVIGAVFLGVGLYVGLTNMSSVSINGKEVALKSNGNRPGLRLTPNGFVF
jgi:hypothetical protein